VKYDDTQPDPGDDMTGDEIAALIRSGDPGGRVRVEHGGKLYRAAEQDDSDDGDPDTVANIPR
jgi:hypothetical protein